VYTREAWAKAPNVAEGADWVVVDAPVAPSANGEGENIAELEGVAEDEEDDNDAARRPENGDDGDACMRGGGSAGA